MYEKELKEIGLNEKEAKVYLAALELGEATVQEIARKSGVKRPTVYLEAESLKQKGLISTIKKTKKTLYYAENPRVIETILDEKKRRLLGIMPGLLSITNLLDKKPIIRFFEGREGVKEVYKDILANPGYEACAWFSRPMIEFEERFFYDFFAPTWQASKIPLRLILPDNETTRSFSSGNTHLEQAKFVSSEKLIMPLEIITYGKNKVGIMSFAEDTAISIESAEVYTAIRSIFNVMWDLL